jgi:glutamate racemase
MRIGVFDSGLGGLTVLRSLLMHIPEADYVYLADTAYAPYGEKSHERIKDRSERIARYLIDTHRIDALVVACNTATSAAIAHLRTVFPSLPIVGTEPGIKPAYERTRTRHVGVLATPATLEGDKYQALADRLYGGSDVVLHEQACPGLVERIEAGEIDTPKTTAMLEAWLAPMRQAKVDTIVLGCTHYPLAAEAIRRIMGTEITLIETGDAIARRLRSLIDVPTETAGGALTLLTTGTIDARAAERIIGRPCPTVSVSLSG